MSDVNYGWLIRYLHANGASMFFIVVYCHIFRGLYYGSYIYPREKLWASGVVIFLLLSNIIIKLLYEDIKIISLYVILKHNITLKDRIIKIIFVKKIHQRISE
jgi:hypothetical protein